MPADDLSRTFLGSGPAGYGVSLVMGAVLTEWNYPGPDPLNPDYGNVVTDGAYVFRDCLVCCKPSELVLGRVLLARGDAGMVIMGNSYQRPPPVIPTDPV